MLNWSKQSSSKSKKKITDKRPNQGGFGRPAACRKEVLHGIFKEAKKAFLAAKKL
jgi:hypothetical protein